MSGFVYLNIPSFLFSNFLVLFGIRWSIFIKTSNVASNNWSSNVKIDWKSIIVTFLPPTSLEAFAAVSSLKNSNMDSNTTSMTTLKFAADQSSSDLNVLIDSIFDEDIKFSVENKASIKKFLSDICDG